MRFSDAPAASLRKWCRWIHRDVSFFLSGVVIIYAVSGIAMNHRRTFNPDYSVERIGVTIPDGAPLSRTMTAGEVRRLLEPLGAAEGYAKHYFPQEHTMKVFIKGGSSLEVDLRSRCGVYEKLTPRPVLRAFTRLHYNPGRWWTWFADLFACGLLLLTLTGIVMVRGGKGLWGRGGVELAAGIAVPLLFLFL